MWQRRQMLGVKAAKIGNVTGRDTKNVVALTSNQETGENLRNFKGRRLEFGKHFRRLSFKGDLDEYKHLMAEPGGVQLRMIPVNDTGLFEKCHATQAGRWGQANGGGQLNIRDAGIVLKMNQNTAVDSVH